MSSIFNDQTFNTVKILGTLITQGSAIFAAGIFSSVEIRRPSITPASIITFTTMSTSPSASTIIPDWTIGTDPGNYTFNIVQRFNATAALAGMNLSLDNASLLIYSALASFRRDTNNSTTVQIDRFANVLNGTLEFTTSGVTDWVIRLTSGTSELTIQSQDENLNIDIGLGQVNVEAGGGPTLLPSMILNNGAISSGGYRYGGVIIAGGATPFIFNSWAGRVTISGVGDIAANGAGNAVILNDYVSATTVGMLVLESTTAATNSAPRIESVSYGSQTITIVIRNSGGNPTGAGATYTFVFTLMQLNP